MKKILSILTVTLLAAITALGQSPSPGIFNYQGVARNSVGNVLVNKTITLRLTIHDGAAAGPTVYQESRTAVTNPFGLFNVQVGSAGASNVTGTIAGVNWGVNSKFIQVEIDPNGGTTFINIGTAQIASVPYALYASLANDLVLPFIKTQAAIGSTLIGLTNSATTGVQGAFTGTSASTDGNAYAITGTISSTSPGGFSSGVRGINNGTGGLGIGVYGSQAGSGWGVYGTTPGGIGVNGATTSGIGVNGSSSSGTGVNGSSTSGVGVFGTSSTSNAGSFSNTNAANAAATLNVNSNGTGWAGDFTSTNATTRALRTAGGVRLTGINEAANRILATIPGNGDATWQSPAAVGIVTGSGTLNFVPKWTPNGTNLGNSQIFDDGTSVGVGTATPAAVNKLEVAGIQRINNTSLQEGGELRFQEGTLFGAPNHWIIDNFQSFAGGNKFRLWNDVGGMNIQMMPGGKTAIGNMVFSDQPQSVLDVEGNLAVGAAYSGTTAAPLNGAIIEGAVGIGTATPGTTTYKLHVNGTGTTGAITTRASIFTGGNLDGANGHGVIADGEWRGVWGRNTGTGGRVESSGVRGDAGGTNYSTGAGLRGTATGTGGNNYGVMGAADNGVNNIGVYGSAPLGANNWAGAFAGRVSIVDGTEGLNKVFASDAVGNGSWQTPAAIGLVTGSGTLNRMAKWTPNGTNLGNSLSWDDGNRVRMGLGLEFADNNTLTVINTSSTGNDAVLSLQGNSGLGNRSGIYLENATNKTHLTVNDYNAASGTKVMTWDGATTNVGIGTVTPTAKLHALSVPATGGPDAMLGESNNTDGSAVAVRGVITSSAPGGFSAGVRGINNGTGGLGIGVYGSQNGSGWGVFGTTPAGIGVYGSSTTGIGVYGQSNSNHSGYFLNNNSGSGFATLVGTTNGIGPAVQGISSGAAVAGWFDIYNPANSQPAVYGSTDGTGNAGFFWNNNVANTTASLHGTNPAANVGSWGIRATSVSGTGFPGEATHAALVAAATTGVGIVTSSPTNYGLHAGSAGNHAVFAQQYGPANAAVYGQGLNPSSFGVVGNTAAGTGAGGYFTGGTTALRTLGGVQLTGINEGVNRILTTTSGTGQATWEDAATAGIVSGSGTLNYLPKWTPNGTTLGNSMIQDNGNAIKVGNSAFYNVNSLNIYPTPTSPEPALMIGDVEVGGLYLEQATGKMHVTLNGADVATGGKAMTFDDATLNVGIGTVSPVANLHVDNTGTGKGGMLVRQDNEPNISASKVLSDGVINDISSFVAFGNNAFFAQRSNFAVGTIAKLNTPDAILGAGTDGNTGVQGISQSGIGVAAVSRTGTALRALISGGGPGLALLTQGGGVQFQNIGEADGYVLTSDATGNATWQGPVGIQLTNMSASVNIPFAYTPITQWQTIVYEDGGANYNPLNGEYTVPVSGVYSIASNLGFFQVAGNGYSSLLVFVNGTQIIDSRESAVANTFPGSKVSISRRLNAGDRISIWSYANGTTFNTIDANNYCNLSITLINR